jgi:hypothetical protein
VNSVISWGNGTRVTESYGVQWLPAWARIIDGPLNRRGELHPHMRYTLEQLKCRRGDRCPRGSFRTLEIGPGGYRLEAGQGEPLSVVG